MRNITPNQFVNSTTFQGRRVKFGIDEKSLAILTTNLSDAYSNRGLAVLRELSTNARDAQLVNGVKSPIEVTLPTQMSNMLIVKDSGVGMSAMELEDIYRRYSASSKRDDVQQTGFLGLGSKAPLALVDLFYVSTVKDGVKTDAFVQKDEDGLAELFFIDTVETTEPSGTTITLPVDATQEFVEEMNKTAAYLFKFWEPGSVLVNGVEPKKLMGQRISDDTIIVENLEKDYIVMGGIPYPVELPNVDAPEGTQGVQRSNGLIEYPLRTYGIVWNVPNDSVHFPLSRESLKYTPKTVEFVENYRQVGIYERHNKWIQQSINCCSTKLEALQTYHRTLNMYDGFSKAQNFSWKSETVPKHFSLHEDIDETLPNGPIWVWNNREGYTFDWRSSRTIDLETIFGEDGKTLRVMFIAGYTPMSKPNALFRRKVLQWQKNYNIEPFSKVIVTRTPYDFQGWIFPVTVDYAEIRKTKVEHQKNGTNPEVKGGYWKTLQLSKYGSNIISITPANEFKKNLVYLTYDYEKMKKLREHILKSILKCLGSEELKRTTFVFVEKNKMKQFRGVFGNRPIWIHDYLTARFNELCAEQFTEEERIALNLGRNYDTEQRKLKYLDYTQIEDPEFSGFLKGLQETLFNEETIRARKNQNTRVDQLKNFAQEFGFKIPNVEPITSTYQPAEHYPLIEALNIYFHSYYHKQKKDILPEAYLYFNEMYNKQKLTT